MEAVAKAKYIKGSPQKMRLVADVIRNKPVTQVMGILDKGFTNKASREISRVVRSAVANFQNLSEGENVDVEDLVIKSIFVNPGPVLKRSRARAQGRFFRILKRTSHIVITVSN